MNRPTPCLVCNALIESVRADADALETLYHSHSNIRGDVDLEMRAYFYGTIERMRTELGLIEEFITGPDAV